MPGRALALRIEPRGRVSTDAGFHPLHEEHESMLEWVGGSFDPKAFSLEDINEWLSDIKA